MDMRAVQDCVKMENLRFVLTNRIKKITPEMSDYQKLTREIALLSLKISSLQNEIKEDK